MNESGIVKEDLFVQEKCFQCKNRFNNENLCCIVQNIKGEYVCVNLEEGE